MGNESPKPKESKIHYWRLHAGEDLIDALYLAASKPDDNLSTGLLKVSYMSIFFAFHSGLSTSFFHLFFLLR